MVGMDEMTRALALRRPGRRSGLVAVVAMVDPTAWYELVNRQQWDGVGRARGVHRG